VLAGSIKDPCDLRLLVGSAPEVSALSEERFPALYELLYSRLSGVGQVSTYMLHHNNLSRGQAYPAFMGTRAWAAGLSEEALLFKSVISPKL
jgi:hypothetical protein